MCRSYFPDGTRAEDAFQHVEEAAGRLGGWENLYGPGYDAEVALMDFLEAWPKVRQRADQVPLEVALKLAERYPVSWLPDESRPSPRYNRFLEIAAWLQRNMGDAPILLPCREVGDLLGTDRDTVSLWRRRAEREGFLRTITPHNRRSKKATEFRFDPECIAKLVQQYAAELKGSP